MGLESLKQDLMTILEEEIDVFGRMLDLLTQEQQALIRNDIDTIQSTAGRQQGMVEEVRLIEARRLQVVRGIGQRFGLSEELLTLSRICDFYEGEGRERVRAMRDRLLGLHADILRVNRNNALLIRHALRYMDRTLQLLKGGDGSNRVYLRSGVADGVAAALKVAVNRVA